MYLVPCCNVFCGAASCSQVCVFRINSERIGHKIYAVKAKGNEKYAYNMKHKRKKKKKEGSVEDIKSQYLQDSENKKGLLFIRKEFNT
jgi:hypothetical protein